MMEESDMDNSNGVNKASDDEELDCLHLSARSASSVDGQQTSYEQSLAS